MSSSASAPIAVLVCSSRKPRVCPQVADFVLDTLKQEEPSPLTLEAQNNPPPSKFEIIDLAERNLPFFDEPVIPAQIHNHNDYAQPHTRAWSQEIQKYSAFIFILPQYNWGYPAILKNAIDFLYNEWKGKSAMIVSYGGHGGGKSAGQLRQILDSVHMNTAETMPALTFPSKQAHAQAMLKGELLRVEGTELWKDEKKEIVKAFEELLTLEVNRTASTVSQV